MFEIIWLISIAFFILFFLTACFEKLEIEQFVPAQYGRPPELSKYFHAMAASARELGFTDLGLFVQNRGSKVYAAVLGFQLSPDSRILLRIGAGKTLGVRIRRTTLISRLTDGRFLETADDFGSWDLSGLTEKEVVLNAHLPELLENHRRRLATATSSPREFPRSNILAVYQEMESDKAEQLGRLGLARPLNLQHTTWRYTMKGAWRQYFHGFRRQLADGKKQADRVRLKRPGDS